MSRLHHPCAIGPCYFSSGGGGSRTRVLSYNNDQALRACQVYVLQRLTSPVQLSLGSGHPSRRSRHHYRRHADSCGTYQGLLCRVFWSTPSLYALLLGSGAERLCIRVIVCIWIVVCFLRGKQTNLGSRSILSSLSRNRITPELFVRGYYLE
jgi:hypothetical protein